MELHLQHLRHSWSACSRERTTDRSREVGVDGRRLSGLRDDSTVRVDQCNRS
jgi:hypothetical protein